MADRSGSRAGPYEQLRAQKTERRFGFKGWKSRTAVKRGIDPGEIIAGAKRYRAHVESQGTEPRFRPQAQTWLNQERWNDQLQAPEPPRLKVGMN